MPSNLDLKSLAVRRDAPPAAGRRRHVITRYVLPALLLVGFAALVAYAIRERLDPPVPVTVVPVMTTRSASAAATM